MMNEIINQIYSFYCNINKIDDKNITINFANKNIFADSCAKITIQQTHSGFFVSDAFASINEISHNDCDSLLNIYDKFIKIAKKQISEINKKSNDYIKVEISESGLIYAENVNAMYINFAIEIITELEQNIVQKYMSTILEKEKKIFISNIKDLFKQKFKHNAIIDYEIHSKTVINADKYFFTGNSGKIYTAPITIINSQNVMMHHDILYTPDDINAVNKIVTNGVDLQMAGNNIRTIYCKHGKNNDSSLLLIKNVMPIISYNDFDKINPATYQ